MNLNLLCFILLSKSIDSAAGHEKLQQFKIIERCDFESFQLAAELSDHYNRNNFRKSNEIKDGCSKIDQSFRFHQDFITEHLGFVPYSMSAGYNGTGLTITNSSSIQLRGKGGWSNISHSSSYEPLYDKYIYFVGDSTIRQIFGAFGSVQRGEHFSKNAKEWSRSTCRKQFPQRAAKLNSYYCGGNEITCDIEGYGLKGRLVYDWKHLMFEEYDKWLWGGTGPWHVDRTLRRPDLLILQTGLHSCFHEYDRRHFDQSNVDQIFKTVPILMKAIQRAIQRVEYRDGQFQPPTTVIIMTSGRKFDASDGCVMTLNRLIVSYARKLGFYVLEREEIERRFVHKSEYADSSLEIPPVLMDFHLPAPLPEIISTAILKTISCAEQSKNKYTFGDDTVRPDNNKRNMTAIAMSLKGIQLHGKIIRLKVRDGNETGAGVEAARVNPDVDGSMKSLEVSVDIVDTVGFRITVHDPTCIQIMQLHSREMVLLDEEEFNAIPVGNPLDIHLCEEGIIHRVVNDKALTIIYNHTRRSVASMEVFAFHNLTLGDIKVISVRDSELLPLGAPLTMEDSTL